MRVNVYSPPDGIFMVEAPDQEARNVLEFSEKKQIASSWAPVPVSISWNPGRGRRKLPVKADFPVSTFRSIVLNEKAKNALEEFLQSYGEFLPLKCSEESLWALNVTRIVDALDFSKSTILERETMNPMAPNVVKFSFVESRIQGSLVFRLPQRNVNQIFFSDEFIDLVQENSLTGFGFRCEWNSEQIP